MKCMKGKRLNYAVADQLRELALLLERDNEWNVEEFGSQREPKEVPPIGVYCGPARYIPGDEMIVTLVVRRAPNIERDCDSAVQLGLMPEQAEEGDPSLSVVEKSNE